MSVFSKTIVNTLVANALIATCYAASGAHSTPEQVEHNESIEEIDARIMKREKVDPRILKWARAALPGHPRAVRPLSLEPSEYEEDLEAVLKTFYEKPYQLDASEFDADHFEFYDGRLSPVIKRRTQITVYFTCDTSEDYDPVEFYTSTYVSLYCEPEKRTHGWSKWSSYSDVIKAKLINSYPRTFIADTVLLAYKFWNTQIARGNEKNITEELFNEWCKKDSIIRKWINAEMLAKNTFKKRLDQRNWIEEQKRLIKEERELKEQQTAEREEREAKAAERERKAAERRKSKTKRYNAQNKKAPKERLNKFLSKAQRLCGLPF